MEAFLVILAIVIWFGYLVMRAERRLPNIRGVVTQSGSASIQARQQSAQMVCPHCQTKGSVTTRRVKLKKGISGGKAARVNEFETTGHGI